MRLCQTGRRRSRVDSVDRPDAESQLNLTPVLNGYEKSVGRQNDFRRARRSTGEPMSVNFVDAFGHK